MAYLETCQTSKTGLSAINSSISQKNELYVCVSGGKKCCFFGKFGVRCFLETPVLRFALLPYYRRTIFAKTSSYMFDWIVNTPMSSWNKSGHSCNLILLLRQFGKCMFKYDIKNTRTCVKYCDTWVQSESSMNRFHFNSLTFGVH